MATASRRRAAPLPAKLPGQVARHALVGLGVIAFALALGTAGYHWIAELPWIDALLNAAMILAGMGPVDPLPTAGAKLFASVYALFSGVVLLGVAGIVFAPVLHRLLHRFHVDETDD
jgi:hypothetical protein